ncbi:MAG TPA: hypothetical protein VFZ02_12350 [Ktedonobacteraceae bacterium]
MGQYQQWLQYQEIDKLLSTQVEALEAELAQIQECLDRFEQQQQDVVPLTDNPIIRVLAAHLSAHHIPPKSNARYIHETNSSSASDSQSPGSGDSISPALLSWGGLPNFELHKMKDPYPVDEQALPHINHPEIELLPEDLIAFFDGHEQTDPQLELPWWLRNITISSRDEQAGRPIDHNSIRTNRLVQRWIERWGRQPSTVLKSTENREEGSGE